MEPKQRNFVIAMSVIVGIITVAILIAVIIVSMRKPAVPEMPAMASPVMQREMEILSQEPNAKIIHGTGRVIPLAPELDDEDDDEDLGNGFGEIKVQTPRVLATCSSGMCGLNDPRLAMPTFPRGERTPSTHSTRFSDWSSDEDDWTPKGKTKVVYKKKGGDSSDDEDMFKAFVDSKKNEVIGMDLENWERPRKSTGKKRAAKTALRRVLDLDAEEDAEEADAVLVDVD